MNTNIIAKQIFDDFENKIRRLPDTDLSNVANGTHELVIKVMKKRGIRKSTAELTTHRKQEILLKLDKCASREEGMMVLSNALKNKIELAQFAKFLEVFILKQDNTKQIQEKIIGATIGAVLRSNAIQGRH